MLVRAEPENADRRALVLDDRRHRCGDDVGAVRPDQQFHFVDADQLGIDARRIRRRALVVVINQLDRPVEQPAFGVDVVAPDFQSREHLLAGRGRRAGQAQTKPDADRIGGLRRRHDAGHRAGTNERGGQSPPAH